MTKKEVKAKVLNDEPVEVVGADQPESGGSSTEEIAPDSVSDASETTDDNSAQMADAVKEWQDKYLRLSAEFDNYRKRTLKEKMELVVTGGEDVIKALLVVMDDIDRALVAMETAQDVASVRQGVLLIHQKLMDTLRARGVEEINDLGQELDLDLHEAVARVPVAEKSKKGKIIDVVQKGYKLKDKVTRFAKVVVGE